MLPDMVLKPVKIRDIDSQGMLCSLKEIGLVSQSEGIYHVGEPVEVGTSLYDLCRQEANLYEIDITPNRGDCLSVHGIARDLSATYQLGPLAHLTPHLTLHDLSQETLFENKSQHTLGYSALRMTIDSEAQTPLFILNRLRRAGIGHNHLVVDILNYVMLLVGQPMHVFDYHKLSFLWSSKNMMVANPSVYLEIISIQHKTMTYWLRIKQQFMR